MNEADSIIELYSPSTLERMKEKLAELKSYFIECEALFGMWEKRATLIQVNQMVPFIS